MRIGVDLGGTKIFTVALKGTEVVAEAKSKTPVQGGPLAVVDAMAATVRALGVGSEAEAVGVGAPGVIDFRSGVVHSAPNLTGWVEPFRLGPALSEALGGTSVTVDNDVNVGTVAEHQMGAAVGSRDVLGVFVGTGVGGGLILNNRLRRGASGYAGEIGHVVVRPGGRRCGCGGRGHLEAYAGRAGMERRARQHEARGRDTLLVELSRTRRMTSSVFARALEARDPIAVALVDRAVETLGLALSMATTLMDIPMVVLGGGLADRLGPSFVARVEEAALALVPNGRADTLRVVPAALSDRGGAIGAALSARVRRPRSSAADGRARVTT
ncbi:MAG TPA: ROK family protein [Acidimicrobiales bacterium]|nr:ROK family protein [Acidimicrobiales bacterium]